MAVATAESIAVPLSAAQGRVIDAALDLFAEHGVGGTSLQMIADEIGVTKAAVYHQFKTKEQIVSYMKGAFAFGHKALLSITGKNEMDEVPANGPGRKMPRIAAATFMMYHNFDHYGQMVEYLRMNGIVPPASRAKSE